MIKITHIITGLSPDGAERMLHRLVANMDSNVVENEVISLTTLGAMAKEIEACGVRVWALGMKRGVPDPRYVLRLASWLRRSRPDVVQTWMYHADLVGGLAAKLAGFDAVVWNIRHSELHASADKRHTLWTAKACARLSRWIPRQIVCASEASRKFHAQIGYANERMQVVPNGFDLEHFRIDRAQRNAIREELGIPQQATVIGLIARYHPIKDHRNFVKAAGLLHREFPQLRFLLCGEGVTSENPELMGWIEAAGLQDACYLLGRREDVPQVLNALDIAVSSSAGEAFPNAVAEAMACGIPCVVTDVGDSRTIVGDTGRVVPAGSPDALAQGCRELLQMGSEVRHLLGLSARERVEQQFGLKSIVQRYQDLYLQVAGSKNLRHDPASGSQVERQRSERPARSLEARPKVLFVDNDVNTFYSYRAGLARAARDKGFEVHVAAPQGKSEDLVRAEGFQYHAIAMTRQGMKPWKELGTIVQLFRLYRKVQPDLVHHLRLKPVLYGGLAATAARVPSMVGLLTGLGYVFMAESRKAKAMRRLVTWAFKLGFRHSNQRVIFQNPDDRAVFVNNGILPVEKTALIKGSGVDVDVYRPAAAVAGVPVVLLASRMLYDKGVSEFVEAAGTLRAAGVPARFVLAGDVDPGNPTAISAEQLRRWSDSGVVEWWGLRNDMLAVLAQSHIVCLPSLREGVPKVLIEAASCGKPIVTTDAPGCREIVRHGDNGLLVPVRDGRALAQALRQLIESPSLRASMGQRGREIVVREFSLEQVVKETLGVYRELLANGANGSRGLSLLEQQAR